MSDNTRNRQQNRRETIYRVTGYGNDINQFLWPWDARRSRRRKENDFYQGLEDIQRVQKSKRNTGPEDVQRVQRSKRNKEFQELKNDLGNKRKAGNETNRRDQGNKRRTEKEKRHRDHKSHKSLRDNTRKKKPRPPKDDISRFLWTWDLYYQN
jgi:hypothetical protein